MTSSATRRQPISLVDNRVPSVSVIVAHNERSRLDGTAEREKEVLDASRDPSAVGSRLRLARHTLFTPRRLTVTDAPVRGDQA
jgi:hypothetical protein